MYHDMTAEKPLAVAQSLYEKKLISYPRTGSRHIPQDVMRTMPGLLHKVCTIPEFHTYGEAFNVSILNNRSVNDAKVTDNHALIVTGVTPSGVSDDERAV